MKTSISPALARLFLVVALFAGASSIALAQEATGDARAQMRTQAQAIAQVRALIDGKRTEQALAEAQAAVRRFPSNTQLRFLEGVTLADTGRTDAAIERFAALTRDHPELAEPWNNLAVLYAGRGELEAARDALEESLRVVPDYALAYENLGDIYLRLAADAYQRATEVRNPSAAARRKLPLARELAQRVESWR